MTATPAPSPGQIWKENDTRSTRLVIIEAVFEGEGKARIHTVVEKDGKYIRKNGCRTVIASLKRFNDSSHGYSYIESTA